MGRKLLRDEVPIGKCDVRALFSWSGESPQDLGFVEGDIIRVLNNGDGDWWTGKLKRNKLVGVFPRNFVEYVNEKQETMSAAKSANRHTQPVGDFVLETFDLDATDPITGLQIPEASKNIAQKPLSVSDLKQSTGSSHTKAVLFEAKSPALNSSMASTKSTLEILDDVGTELNGGFLDDIDLDVKPEELRTPELVNEGFQNGPPIPPPHTTSLQSSKNSRRSTNSMVPQTPILKDEPSVSSDVNDTSILSGTASGKVLTGFTNSQSINVENSALTGPVITSGLGISDELKDPNSLPPMRMSSLTDSPIMDAEVPFDPKTFKTESKIPDHIGSHFDNAYNSMSTLAEPKGSIIVQKNRNSGEIKSDDGKKPSFIHRLFPKNTQMLRRSASRSSQKSSKSSKSVKSRLRNVKSLFSFSPSFEPDENLYPTNILSKPESSALIGAPLKPIQTPPRSKVSSTYDTTAKMKASSSSNKSSNGNGSSLLGVISAGPLNSKEIVGGKWIETRRDLYRAQTLTERDLKKRRQELELQGVNCDNLVAHLNRFSSNLMFHDYRLESFDDVDQAVLHMSTWPQLMTPSVFASSRIGRHFQDPIERVRAVFLLCATRIQHVSSSPQPNNVMHSRCATPAELADTVKDMCNAIDIECKVVNGHIRTIAPDSKSIISTPHSWNAVKINNEWRFLDCVTSASTSSTQHSLDSYEEDGFVNLFYFLTPPSQLLFSHVPNSQQDQFSEYPLPTASAALLPLAAPAAFAYDVMFKEFWLGLTRVADLEVVELDLLLADSTKDLIGFVDGESQYTLCQPYYDFDTKTRHVRVKAFVPQHSKQSLLQLYIVPKSQADRTPSAMELVWSLELRHVSGAKHNVPFEFIGRYAMSTNDYDLYVKQPQCRSLGGGDLYDFKVDCFASNGDMGLKQPSLAIQSPSGRLTRMIPIGTNANDTFKAAVKTLEVGVWRGVARISDEDSWVPFCEWFCS